MAERRSGRLVFAIPGTLDTLTGGYLYDAKIIAGLRKRGHAVELLQLGEGFPAAADATLRHATESLIKAAETCDTLIVDGLALGVLPEAARCLCTQARLIALVHHPLAYEHGLTMEMAARLHQSERQALACAWRIVANSQTTARLLCDQYAIEPERVRIARPGTEPGKRSRPYATNHGGTVKLLSVGAISPRKGFDVLIAALSGLRDLDWNLTIAGDDTRSPETSAALRTQINVCGLGSRISLAGAVDPVELARLYSAADAFVLASHFEGYGMAYAEALSYGLPVIGTTGGAITEVVPGAAGILVPPGEPDALAAALRSLLCDVALRQSMAAAATQAGQGLPRWSDAVDVFEALLNEKDGR